MYVQAVRTVDSGHASLLDGINDSDLADGAGQVLLEFLKSNFGDFGQMEILDVQDLKKALEVVEGQADGDDQLKDRLTVLIRILHLLGAGYYRSLLLEERDRVGRVNYRFEAMMRLKERIQRDVTDAPRFSQLDRRGSSIGFHETLVNSRRSARSSTGRPSFSRIDALRVSSNSKPTE